jgi:hypothetical protein
VLNCAVRLSSPVTCQPVFRATPVILNDARTFRTARCHDTVLPTDYLQHSQKHSIQNIRQSFFNLARFQVLTAASMNLTESSGMYCRVLNWMSTDVSEVCAASIIRAMEAARRSTSN